MLPASKRPLRPALVVMGVAGSGKSACGMALAHRIGVDFVDGDDLHPPANVAKMSSGTPLTDEDRWPWLDRVGTILGEDATHLRGIVIACSSLRRAYRDRIRVAGGAPTFVFLDITPDEARRRLADRPGHFMPVSLVESQFATLERPSGAEPDVVTIEETEDVDATVDAMLSALGFGPNA